MKTMLIQVGGNISEENQIRPDLAAYLMESYKLLDEAHIRETAEKYKGKPTGLLVEVSLVCSD